MLVKEWPLVCTMFNGDSIMGLVPTLFAENIEVRFKKSNLNKQYKLSKYKITQVAKRALVADPAKAHQDMLRLVSRMSIPENIPPGKAAFSITTKP